MHHRTGEAELARAELSLAIERYREMAMTFWSPETATAPTVVEEQL
jgi:hypothetical protein